MPWAKLDDAYPSHPKAIAAGLDGMGLDAAAICYANRYGTDGVITTATLNAVAPGARNLRKVAAKLVEVGRWHTAGHDCPACPQPDDGWVIHDFHDYNPTADEDQAKRQARAEAGRKGGQRSKRGKSKSQASAYPDGEASASKQTEANGKHDPPKQNNPVPSRPPTESSSEDSGPPDGGDAGASDSQRPRDHVFEALIEVCELDASALTKSERGKANKAAKELRDIGATPDGIRARAQVYRQRWPECDLTPTALSSNYGQLGTAPKPNGTAPTSGPRAVSDFTGLDSDAFRRGTR